MSDVGELPARGATFDGVTETDDFLSKKGNATTGSVGEIDKDVRPLRPYVVLRSCSFLRCASIQPSSSPEKAADFRTDFLRGAPALPMRSCGRLGPIGRVLIFITSPVPRRRSMSAVIDERDLRRRFFELRLLALLSMLRCIASSSSCFFRSACCRSCCISIGGGGLSRPNRG